MEKSMSPFFVAFLYAIFFVYRRLSGGDTVRRNFKKENILKYIAEIAFGKPNDAVKLAFLSPEELSDAIDALNLTMLSEIKRSGSGVEVKLINRMEALKLLMAKTDSESGRESNAELFFQAINAAAGAKSTPE
jgi:hypothetical protein